MTGWGRSSTENCARILNLTIRLNGICTIHNLSRRMRRTNFFWDFEIQTNHLQQKETPCWIVNFAVQADHEVKSKESKKKDKYPDLTRELKNNCDTWKWRWSYLPTPPLGQDMTQGQFLSGVWQVWIQSFPSPRLVASPRLKNLVCPTIWKWRW